VTEEIGSEEATRLEEGAIIVDVRGQICPDPQIAAKIALMEAESGRLVVIYTDHVDAVENVSNGVKELVSRIRVWRPARGEYKIFLWKK
jgi:TusA-related sulfurtransferase